MLPDTGMLPVRCKKERQSTGVETNELPSWRPRPRAWNDMNSGKARGPLAVAFLLLVAVSLEAAPGSRIPAAYQFEAVPRPVLAAASRTSSWNPKLGRWAADALYLLAVSGSPEHSQLCLSVSHDGGDTFSAPVPVSDGGVQIRSDGEANPSLAVSGHGGIYALWEQERSDGGTDLRFARSVNNGHSFEKPILVTDKIKPSANDFSSLAVAPDGSIYAVWLDGRDPTAGPHGTSVVYLARSSDGGATFGKNVQVAAGACHCSRPALAFGPQGEVFVAWRAVFLENIRDVVVAASVDQGETFGPQERVAKDDWRIDGCPHSGPSLAVKGNRLYVSWFTEGTGRNPGIRVSWSDDDGASFAPPRLASGRILDANHPTLSVSADGRLVLVFQGRNRLNQHGWAPLQAYLEEISDAGQLSPPVPVPGRRKSVVYPVVLAGSLGRVFVAWSEPSAKGSQIVLSRGRRTE
jgi:hypothetical protein